MKKNKFNFFLLSFAIHLLLISFFYIPNKNYKKAKTSIVEVKIINQFQGNKEIHKIINNSEEKNFKKKTYRKPINSSEIKEKTNDKTLKKKIINYHSDILPKDQNFFSKEKTKTQYLYSHNPNTSKRLSKASYKVGSKLNPHPPYPMIARKNGWEGSIILEVYVRSNGLVKNVNIYKSSGYNVLDNVSVKTIKKWHFTPASLGDIKIDDKLKIPIRFSLKD